MEYLRWILLVAGLAFVFVIYLIGKKRKRQDTYSDYDLDDDAPEFGANDWDEIDDGVGDVRIVARESSDYDDTDDEELSEADTVDEQPDDQLYDQQPVADEVEPEQTNTDQDVIVLYILARSSGQMAGDKINSAAQANGLEFGKMDIFHRLDDAGKSVFSLANMVEPGSFDADAMHEIKTPGIIFFLQISSVADPSNAFDDMLECAYHISEMLDAQLCNHKRQPTADTKRC